MPERPLGCFEQTVGLVDLAFRVHWLAVSMQGYRLHCSETVSEVLTLL